MAGRSPRFLRFDLHRRLRGLIVAPRRDPVAVGLGLPVQPFVEALRLETIDRVGQSLAFGAESNLLNFLEPRTGAPLGGCADENRWFRITVRCVGSGGGGFEALREVHVIADGRVFAMLRV